MTDKSVKYKIKHETIHPDNGCVTAKAGGYPGTCLACPLPKCLEEIPKRAEKKRPRNDKIRQGHEAGMKVTELSSLYHCSIRTIERVLARREA